jgi:hypothetical protein
MKKFFALLILACTTVSTAHGLDAQIDGRLYGLWHVTEPVYQDEEMTVRLDVTFNQQDATIKASCFFPENIRIDVSATSRVRYTDKIIRPLENKEATKKGPNGHECSVAIQPFDLYYTIKNAKSMEISDATGLQKFGLHKD